MNSKYERPRIQTFGAAQIVELMRAHKGNVSAVARELDKERVQIRRWCKRLGIDVASYR